jgi:hypothetical protein
VLDQHLTKPEEKEEVVEHKATFLDALKGPEAVTKGNFVNLIPRKLLL